MLIFATFWNLNPIWTRGEGHYGPEDKRSSAVSTWIALHSPNFLTLFLLLFYKSQKSHFQKKFFFAKNMERRQKYPKGGPFYAKIKISKKILFLGKYYFFCLNMNCT